MNHLATAALLVSLLGAADDRLLPSLNQPPPSPPAVKAVIRQSDELLRVYRETGKTEAAKAKLLACIRRVRRPLRERP